VETITEMWLYKAERNTGDLTGTSLPE